MSNLNRVIEIPEAETKNALESGRFSEDEIAEVWFVGASLLMGCESRNFSDSECALQVLNNMEIVLA